MYVFHLAINNCYQYRLYPPSFTHQSAYTHTALPNPRHPRRYPEHAKYEEEEEMDEDAQLAAALAMSTGGAMPGGVGGDNEEEMECQLVACRCLAHLLEALPGTAHTLVHLGAVPVLCSKLNEIAYIELAEQTLSVS